MIDTWTRANQLIPGGNHLFSKTPDRYCPGQWPAYYKRAQGITIETPDGKTYKDFSVMGAGNSTLGYGDPDVDNAVHDAIFRSNVSTLNCEEEVLLAEMVLKMNPKMDLVRCGRSGDDACQVALRIAQEYSGKRRFAICGYHGWKIGHPPQLDPESVPFDYGDIEGFHRAIGNAGIWSRFKNWLHPVKIVMMECIRNKPVDVAFLKEIRETCDERGIVLIFDEVASGFRANYGGYHQKIGIYPDIVLYGKAMGNGYAISAVVGKEEVMQAAKNTFISSMFWSERIGYSAGLATLDKMKRKNVPELISLTGLQAKQMWASAAEEAGLTVEISGLDALASFQFSGDEDRVKITTFTQEMLKRGYLASNQFYPSVCHTTKEMDLYAEHLRDVFYDIADKVVTLEGEPSRPGFKRLA